MAVTSDNILAMRNRIVDEPPAPGDIYATAGGYVGQHKRRLERLAKLDALVDGRWDVVWPDETVTSDMPKVADFVTSDLEDLSALVASAEPTVIVDPDSDKEQFVTQALMRQHIISTYRAKNRMGTLRRQTAMDLAGAGMACWVIWPDYWNPDPTQRYPLYMRRDPRHVFPDPSMTSPDDLQRLIVTYRTKARLLVGQYPRLRDALYTTQEQQYITDEDLEVIEYYDGDWCIKLVARPAKPGSRGNARLIELARVPNRTASGCPLAIIGARTTWDGQFRGQFDKVLGPLGTANRMMELHLAQLADMIYSEKIVRGVFDNPQDMGPGATLYTTDYQASIERAKTAQSSHQLYTDVQLLLDQARESAGVPQARHGDVDQNIASAQFVTAIQGKYITAVRNYQEILGDMETRANSLALEVDEAYLDQGFPKKLAVVRGGRSTKGVYVPSVDIAGRYENRVVYGAGSGLDSYNRKIAAIQDVQARLVSRRTVRSQLEYAPDTLLEEAEMNREAMEDGFLAMLQDPAFDSNLKLLALSLAADGESMLTIAKKVFEAQQAALAQQAQLAAAQSELVAGTEQVEGGGGGGEQAAAPQLPALSSIGGY